MLWGRVLAVVLTGAVVLTAPACADLDRGAVPRELVGVWLGGDHGNGPWCYEFSADGTYRAWPQRAPGAMNSGTVVVDEAIIWFSNGGAPVRQSWSVSGDVLQLGAERFLRASVA